MNLIKYSSFIFVIICISILTMTRAQNKLLDLRPGTNFTEFTIGLVDEAIASGRLTSEKQDDLIAIIDSIQNAYISNSRAGKPSKFKLDTIELTLASAVSEILAPDDVQVSAGPSTGSQVGSGGYHQGGPAAASSPSYVKESFGSPSLPVSVATYAAAAAKNGNGGNEK